MDSGEVDAFISIACEMKVNPLLPGMLYAYPISGGGIVPIMGPSGVYKKLVEHPEVASWETEVFPPDVTLPPTHAITKIWRKGVERPLTYTALLSEWKIESNPNWRTRPRHMLALRSLKHCANQIIHGIPYDEDDRVIMAMQNVTGTGEEGSTGASETASAETKVERAPVKERVKRGAAGAKAAEVVVTPEQQQEAAKPAEPAQEVKPVENIQQAMEARQEKVAEAAKPPEPAPEKRVFLKEGETLTAACKLEAITPTFITTGGVRSPGFRATVSGGFNNEVRCVIGAKAGIRDVIKDGKPVLDEKGKPKTEEHVIIDPEFVVGKTVNLVLVGKMSTAPASSPLHGKVLAWVSALAQTAASEEA